nr:trypsin-like peptidase domain-containing protein [uncultured Nitrososphaera sp.]
MSYCADCDKTHGVEKASATEIKELAALKLLGQAGIIGVGTGHNSPTTIRLYLKDDAEAHRIPKELGGFQTQVVVTGNIKALGANQQRERPVQGGLSVSPEGRVETGTLGAIVFDKDGVAYGLSNAHVLSDTNAIPYGTPIKQPGGVDGGIDGRDTVGTLEKDAKVTLSSGANNIIDAAIFRLADQQNLDLAINLLGMVVSDIEPAVIGMPVVKSGRTTDVTSGAITDVSATIIVDYGGGQSARFTNQIIIEPAIVSPGDSGSLLINSATGKAVGLVFAGSETVGIANKIGYVMSAFGITFTKGGSVTQAPVTSDPIGDQVGAWTWQYLREHVFTNTNLAIGAAGVVGAAVIIKAISK